MNDRTTFFLDLHLNAHTESELGPGIWLDPATLAVDTNLPEFYIHTTGNPFGYYRRIAVGTLSPSQIITSTTYRIILNSAPGTAAQDNANLDIILGYKLFPGCSFAWCVLERTWCRVNEEDWTVAPIPGIYSWTQPGDCYDWFLNWLPYTDK